MAKGLKNKNKYFQFCSEKNHKCRRYFLFVHCLKKDLDPYFFGNRQKGDMAIIEIELFFLYKLR